MVHTVEPSTIKVAGHKLQALAVGTLQSAAASLPGEAGVCQRPDGRRLKVLLSPRLVANRERERECERESFERYFSTETLSAKATAADAFFREVKPLLLELSFFLSDGKSGIVRTYLTEEDAKTLTV